MSTGSDHSQLWTCLASEEVSCPSPDNPYKVYLFLFRKAGMTPPPGLIIADQLPPILSSAQSPLNVTHTTA